MKSDEVRWLVRRDIKQVLDIEKEIFKYPWSEEIFISNLKQRNCIGLAIEQNDEIIGYAIYKFTKKHIEIFKIGIKKNQQKNGFGSKIIQKLIEKLSKEKRPELSVLVRESNLDAQLFFKSQGFKATEVIKNFYEETQEDAYEMKYSIKHQETNRISDYLESTNNWC